MKIILIESPFYRFIGYYNRYFPLGLPSYFEGLSISLLEATACGIPVVITKQRNFPKVEKIGAGKVIDVDANNLSETLIELLDKY